MAGNLIPLPTSRLHPASAMTAETAFRVLKLYEAAIALGFRAELYTATGAHQRAHRCRRAVSRLRRLALSCLLTNLPREELPHFMDRLYHGQAPASPLWQLCV